MTTLGSFIPGRLGLRAIQDGPHQRRQKREARAAGASRASTVGISDEARRLGQAASPADNEASNPADRSLDAIEASTAPPRREVDEESVAGMLDPTFAVMAGLVEEMLDRPVELTPPRDFMKSLDNPVVEGAEGDRAREETRPGDHDEGTMSPSTAGREAAALLLETSRYPNDGTPSGK